MFENAVTQTYTQQDATLEILTMLGGTFLLGCLLCWLIRGLVAKNKSSATNNNYIDTSIAQKVAEQNTSSASETSSAIGNSASKPRTVVAPTVSATSYTTPRIDDLTKISGITQSVQKELKVNGINSFTDLRDAKKESLNLSESHNFDSKEMETWPHQASLAAKGEWKKLAEYQEFTQRSRDAHKNSKSDSSLDSNKDDLKKIEGIGPRIEEILNRQGIYTFETLGKTDRDTLKKYLITADKRFDANETESWPHQAGMAEKGQWEELKIYQEFIDEDDNEDELSPAVSLTTKRAPSSSFTSNVSNITKKDDLKKIEGIGPRIEELLQKNNISSFEQLKACSKESLMAILENAGPQYKMHEPNTWPEQAQMAFNGEWKKLTEFQNLLLGNRK